MNFPIWIMATCQKCSDDYTVDKRMEPIGPLTISPNKIQSQEFQCPECKSLFRVTIASEEI